MTKPRLDPILRVVFATILLLGIAWGAIISVIGKFLEAASFSKTESATLNVCFAGGLVVMALPAGRLIRRLGGRAVLILGLLGYAVVTTAFPFVPKTMLSYGLVRFFDGAFSVNVLVTAETIVLSRSPADRKGYYTSIYALLIALGWVIGSIIAGAVVPHFGRWSAFATAGAFGVIAAVDVALRLPQGAERPREGEDTAPSSSSKPLGTGEIFARIKTCCLSNFSYGYFQASTGLFLPLYLTSEKHFTDDQTLVVPAFFAGGMVICASCQPRASGIALVTSRSCERSASSAQPRSSASCSSTTCRFSTGSCS